MKNKIKNSEGKIDYTDLSSDVVGSTAGAAIGLVAAGPIGAMIGAASGPIISSLIQAGAEFAHRKLSHSERFRIESVITVARDKFKKNMALGLVLRADDFFDSTKGRRSDGDEMVEAVLRACQEEHEEKKLIYFGNLIANIAFRPDIDRDTANVLVRLAEQLSYRQLRYIALMAQKSQFGLYAINTKLDNLHSKHISRDELPFASLASEISDLVEQNILRRNPNGVQAQEIVTSLTSSGYGLYELMELSQISRNDLEPLAIMLSERKSKALFEGVNVGCMPVGADNIVRENDQWICLLVKTGNDAFTIDGAQARITEEQIRFQPSSTIRDQTVFVFLKDENGQRYCFHKSILDLLEPK